MPNIPLSLMPDDPAKIVEAGQLKSTALDRLCELAGRACYDSLGKGRTSEGYHQHLIDVNHGSVHEHANLTFQVLFPHHALLAFLVSVINRPGVFVLPDPDGCGMRLTVNLRALREWHLFTTPGNHSNYDNYIRHAIGSMEILAREHAPLAFPNLKTPGSPNVAVYVELIEPAHDEEKWVSLFMSGSRGFTHELVRHKYRTAVSQRSTRYVDEDGSPWVHHPLVEAYVADTDDVVWRSVIADTVMKSQGTYNRVVATLEPWLIAKGADKFTARKQARGAARGYLGNALYTECVFSASVAQWKRMLKQRATLAADAEIRRVFCEALHALQQSRYGADFSDFELVPSPDGLGDCLK